MPATLILDAAVLHLPLLDHPLRPSPDRSECVLVPDDVATDFGGRTRIRFPEGRYGTGPAARELEAIGWVDEHVPAGIVLLVTTEPYGTVDREMLPFGGRLRAWARAQRAEGRRVYADTIELPLGVTSAAEVRRQINRRLLDLAGLKAWHEDGMTELVLVPKRLWEELPPAERMVVQRRLLDAGSSAVTYSGDAEGAADIATEPSFRQAVRTVRVIVTHAATVSALAGRLTPSGAHLLPVHHRGGDIRRTIEQCVHA